MSVVARLGWVDGADELPLARRCELAEVPHATVYRRLAAKPLQDASAEDLLLCHLIDEQYTNRPFNGSRRMVILLRAVGHLVDRKRVQRLMRGMGLAGMAPGPNRALRITGSMRVPTAPNSFAETTRSIVIPALTRSGRLLACGNIKTFHLYNFYE